MTIYHRQIENRWAFMAGTLSASLFLRTRT